VSEQPQVPEADFRSYYGRPILKMPRWKEPHLPLYLFLGGLSGASAVMGAAAALTGRRTLARAGRLTAAAAAAGGTGFLIAELGRPERFLHMLRVAKPTSPMSMGSWLLAAHASLAGAAAASDVTGVVPRLGAAAGAASALTGPLLATYTGVLLADTAVPAWHEGQRQLPFLFAGSAMTSAAAAGLAATALGAPGDRVPAARLAVLGTALELAAAAALEHRTGLVGETYQQGGAGEMMRAARWLTPAGAVAALAAPRSRVAAVAAAGLLTAGAVTTRFGVFRAGPASVADPKYVIASQRPAAPAGQQRGV
jgi:formate-dependent nitrite reductase membrane component NrfD